MLVFILQSSPVGVASRVLRLSRSVGYARIYPLTWGPSLLIHSHNACHTYVNWLSWNDQISLGSGLKVTACKIEIWYSVTSSKAFKDNDRS